MAEKEKREQESFRVDIEDAPKPRPFVPVATPSVTQSPTISIIAYCGASILMTLANKYVLSGYHFNLNFFLLVIQNVICVATIQAGKTMGIINFVDFKVEEGRKWFPISMLLIAMIYTGSKAIQYLSVPVYTIFKNMTIILIAYGEVLWFGSSVTKMVLFSFGLMVLSSVVAAWADVTAALDTHGTASEDAAQKLSTLNAGYIWMLVNCFSSAAYVLGMRKRIKLTNFKDFDTMFYNNFLSIPILFLCSVFLEDWSQENFDRNFPKEIRSNLSIAIFFTGVSSIFISYCSAWCVRVTSSTTYSMVGALNKLPIALAGLIFFDAPVTLPSCTAIFLGFVSGLVYAIAKVKSSVKAAVLPMSSSSQSIRDGFGQKS